MPRLATERARRLLGIGLPIVGGMLSQNLLDIIDTLMVAQLGPAAIAAVGIAAFANFVIAGVVIGLGSGVQTIVARRLGEGRDADAAVPLNGGLVAALLIGAVMGFGGFLLAPTVFPYLVDHRPEVIAEGVPYFQARLVGVAAIGLNFCFRGYWYGIGDTRTYLKIIITIHLVNVVLSYCLIFGALGLPELGTLGAGVGTTAALFFGSVLYFVATLRRARPHGFLRRLPRGQTFRSLLVLSSSSAAQTTAFAASLTVLFWIAGQVSTEALAISNVIINAVKVAVLPTLAFGLATMTLVSGALGRGDPDDAARWVWDAVRTVGLFVALIGAGMLIFPATIMDWFLDDPEVIALGAAALAIPAITLGADVVAILMSHALSGAGAARTTLIVTVTTQWLVGLPLAYTLAVPLGLGLEGVWLGQLAYRFVAAGTFIVLWQRGGWKHARV